MHAVVGNRQLALVNCEFKLVTNDFDVGAFAWKLTKEFEIRLVLLYICDHWRFVRENWVGHIGLVSLLDRQLDRWQRGRKLWGVILEFGETESILLRSRDLASSRGLKIKLYN